MLHFAHVSSNVSFCRPFNQRPPRIHRYSGWILIVEATQPENSANEEAEEKAIEEAEQKAESSYIKSSICDYWKGNQGLSHEESQEQYIEILKKWPGYSSTLFDVKCTDGNFPPELWLGVSATGIAVYKRYEQRALMSCEYEYILSFGAPQSNVYKIIVEGRGGMVFETNQVVEIAKLMKAYINEIVRRRSKEQNE